MAGHSKWANIKHRKGKADAKKGKAFSQVAKEIISAVKQGGPDPKSNTRLRLAILKARQCNMPTDNVERNIKKASGSEQVNYEEVTYEIYGHGGVGLIVEITTDNKNRVASEMRIATNKKGGNIATPGSVAFNFECKGIIQVKKEGAKEDDLFLLATEAGAEDFDAEEEGVFIITTAPSDLYAVHDKIAAGGYAIESANLEMIPKVWVPCNEENKLANEALIDFLDDLEDVNNVYHNMDE